MGYWVIGLLGYWESGTLGYWDIAIWEYRALPCILGKWDVGTLGHRDMAIQGNIVGKWVVVVTLSVVIVVVHGWL